MSAGATATYTLNFSPVGGSTFANGVTYSCATSGLPPLSNCSFSPIQLAAGSGPTIVILKIATTPPPGGTVPGNYTITVNAMSGSASDSVPLALHVTLDFSIFNNTSPVTIKAGQIATYSLDVDPAVLGSTFPSDVTLSCSGFPTLSSCSFTPMRVAAGSRNTNVILTITTTAAGSTSGTPQGNYSVTVTAAMGSLSHSIQVTLIVRSGGAFDFTIFNNTSPVTITAGQIATYSLDVDPAILGNTFPSNVTLSCSGLPAVSTCAFAPIQVASGSGNTNVILTIQTTGAIPASARLVRKLTASLYWLWLPLPGIVFAGFAGNNFRRKKIGACAVLSLVLVIVMLQAACGGGLSGGGSAQPGTPQGNYSVTVTAAMGSLSHSVPVTLNVKP